MLLPTSTYAYFPHQYLPLMTRYRVDDLDNYVSPILVRGSVRVRG